MADPSRPSRRAPIAAIVVTALAIALTAGVSAVALVRTPAGAAIRDWLGLGRTFSQADADAALLTPDDLPGYAVADPADGPDNEDDDLVPCGGRVTVNRIGTADTRRETNLSGGGFGPFLTQVTALVPAGAAARSSIEDLRHAFADCREWTQPNGDRYTVDGLSSGGTGDDAVMVRLTVHGDELTLQLAIIAIRKGNLVSMLTLAGFPDLSDGDVEQVTTAAAAQLPA